MMNPSGAATFKQGFLRQIEFAVQPVQFDCRDPWPNSLDAYVIRNVLSKGNFGSIKYAITCDNDLMSTDGNESRGCIIKTINLEKLFDRVIQEAKAAKKPTSLQIKSPEARLQRIIRRLVMELFVTNRCRHENILHFHSVFVDSEGLHFAMPRFHVLKEMIDAYRDLHNQEPISMSVIARIVRQLCKGLDYLHSIGIIHRDVQPEHILLTRNATVKLCHFSQSKALVTDQMKAECRTPIGKEEFMCSEKLFNLREAHSLDACRPYNFDADIWSIGVLILSMISYFPNEKFQKLRKDFALVLDREQMPFSWLTSDMVQLRARLLQSGGEDLKSFLNDHIFTLDPKKRLTARGIMESECFLRWCSPSIAEDKLVVKKKFIGEIDFANRFKLSVEGNNFDALESKNIPAEFYWDSTWKLIEQTKFVFKMMPDDRSKLFAEKCFQFSESAPLFEVIFAQIEKGVIGLADVNSIHCNAHQMAFDLISEMQTEKKGSNFGSEVERTIHRKYQPCQGFSSISTEPLVLQMSLFQQSRRRLSSDTDDSLSQSFSFNDTC